MPDSKPSFRFSFTFDDGQVVTMLSFDEARDALATELSQLNHIAELANTLGVTLSVAFSDFSHDLATLTATAMDLAKAKIIGQKRQEEFITEIDAYLKKYGKGFSPGQRRARLIDIIPTALKEKRFEDANDAFEGFVSGGPLLVLDDVGKESTSAVAALQSSHQENGDELQAIKKDFDSLRASHATLDAVIKEVMRVQNEFVEAGKQKLAETDEKLASFENVHADMKAKLALNESVSYWSGKKGKKRKHVKRFRLYALLLVVWVIVSGGLLCAVLAHFLLNSTEASSLMGFMPYLPINILLLFLAVWGVRIFARLLLNENHLAAQAEEKGAMLQTYLALLNEGAALSEDRSVALEAIFAPARDVPVEGSRTVSPADLTTDNLK